MSSQEAPLSIYIPRVHCKITRQEIYQAFQNAGLGEVDRVDFVAWPSAGQSAHTLYKSGFIHFHHWFNNSSVEELHKKIHDPEQTAKLVYDNPWYWILLPNRRPLAENQKDLPLRIQKLEDMIEHQTTLLVRMAETINSNRLQRPPVTPSDDELATVIHNIRGLIDAVHTEDSCSTSELLFRFLEQIFDMSLEIKKAWIGQQANQLWRGTPPISRAFVPPQNTNSESSRELTEREGVQTCQSDTSSSDNIPVIRLNLSDRTDSLSASPIRLHVDDYSQNDGGGVEETKTTCESDRNCTGCGMPLCPEAREGWEPRFENSWECESCWKSRIEQTLGLRSGELGWHEEMIREQGRAKVEEELIASAEILDALGSEDAEEAIEIAEQEVEEREASFWLTSGMLKKRKLMLTE